jgi:pre-mRNA-splicing factor SYF1
LFLAITIIFYSRISQIYCCEAKVLNKIDMKSFENVVTNHLKFYEDEVARNPYSLKSWLNILMFLDGSINRNYRFEVYERALIFLPRSYKLWKAYLKERNANLHGKPLNHKSYIFLVDAYERAIVHLHKMPLIW